ncbi:MAG: toxin [bacterium]
MEFRWDPVKDKKLIQERGVSASDLMDAVLTENLIAVTAHPKRANQVLIFFHKNGYVYVAACVEEGAGTYFIKTIYPSRKAQKRYCKLPPSL